MRRHITAAALAVTLGFAGVAQADEDSGLYVGAGVGQFNLEIDDFLQIDEVDIDTDDTAFKVFGGWRFNPFMALEIAYIDFGAPSETFSDGVDSIEIETSVSGFAPYLVTSTQFGMVELFAKIGYLFYDAEIEAVDIGTLDDTSDEDLVYAIGIGVVLMDQLNLRLEYEQVDVSTEEDIGDTDASAYWLTGAWRF